MYKIVKYLLVVLIALAIIGCDFPFLEEEPEVGSLTPGKIIGASENTYYQEFDMGLGEKTIEGIIDLSDLEEKTDDIGYPIVSVSLGLAYEYVEAGGADGQHIPVQISNIYISPNIETGKYKITGLPTVSPTVETGIVGRVVIDLVDNAMDKERFFIRKYVDMNFWNSSILTTLSDAKYKAPDSSITLNVNYTYMVDEYWLANGVQQNPDSVSTANYTEKTFDQIAETQTIYAAMDGNGGLLFINHQVDVDGGITYGFLSSPFRDEYQNGTSIITTLSGGVYREISAGINIGGNIYDNRKIIDLTLNSGDNVSQEITIYIPNIED